MRNFQELDIWNKSHQLSLSVYKITRVFPKDELYGLVSQLRRSSSSIATNIAEGCGRNTNPELKRFLTYSAGSCSELQYQLLLSKDLSYLDLESYKELSKTVVEVRKMIYAFIRNMDPV
jgi:four helix bundle protein